MIGTGDKAAAPVAAARTTKTTIKVGLNFMGADRLFGGAFEPLLQLAAEADSLGIDMLSFPDHVAMAKSAFETAGYSGVQFPFPRDMAWYEPVTSLAAFAGATRRARLAINVLIGPLRPCVLLAKQIATLDVISSGRVLLGLGGGWQRAEYDAAGVAFDGRFGVLEEQIEACRVLWTEAPASYRGRHVVFEDLYAMPFPVQGKNLPIWLGLPATGRHVERIARLADGWSWGFVDDVAVVADGVRVLHEALRKFGRDPAGFEVKAFPTPITRGDGTVDMAATFARVPSLVEAGVTLIEPNLFDYCRRPEDIERLLDHLLEIKARNWD